MGGSMSVSGRGPPGASLPSFSPKFPLPSRTGAGPGAPRELKARPLGAQGLAERTHVKGLRQLAWQLLWY